RPTIEQRARDGTGFGAVFGTTAVTDAVTIGFVFDHIEDPAVQRAAVIRLFEMTAQVSAGMSEIYAAERDRIEAEQQARIAELSTPVVPLYEGILVLPLVGEIDSDRAGHIMESLLEEISREQADVVIIDITGVPVVDTGVANYLVQTAKAVKLLGSTVVLVGIGAEIAQTLVQLGVDLSNITTRANLQSGIEFAFGELGLEIHERH
ncbi:MAG TPA: STAS domain-containing protein, partial [Herpetosiphonaceae bacterium]